MCLCTEHRLYMLVFSLQLPDRATCIDQRSPVQPVRGSASPSELRSVLRWAPLVSQLVPRLAFPVTDLIPQRVRPMWKLDANKQVTVGTAVGLLDGVDVGVTAKRE